MTLYGLQVSSQAPSVTTLGYPNPDVPYVQFMGNLSGSNAGHTTAFWFNTPANFTGNILQVEDQ